MNDNIIEVFERFIKVEFDERLYNAIKIFRWNWGQKSDEYIEFLGSNLTGVHTIRFSVQDEDILFLDILNTDRSALAYELHRTKGIDKNHKVASNVTYLTLTYVMHKFATSKTIGKHMEDAIKETYYVFAYKAISSLYSHYFKYPVEPSIALMVNEKLSNKFMIKKVKNWQEFFEYRSKDLLPRGLHWDRLLHYDAKNAVYMVPDIQGRLRDLLKNVYQVLLKVNENNERIVSTSLSTTEEDGEMGIGDLTNRPDIYIKYTQSICRSKKDFINVDLCKVVERLSNLKLTQGIDQALEVVCEKYEGLEQLIDDVTVSSIEHLANKDIRYNYDRDLYTTIINLKTLYSNHSKIKLAKKAKEDITKFMTSCKDRRLKGKNFFKINMAVAVCVYSFLRAILRNK